MGKPLQSATTVKLPWTTSEGLLVCVELDLNLFQIQDSIQQGANRATGEGVFERELHLQVSRITQHLVQNDQRFVSGQRDASWRTS